MDSFLLNHNKENRTCPGCKLDFSSERKCARHLLQYCIYIDNVRNMSVTKLRLNCIQWFINFLKPIDLWRSNDLIGSLKSEHKSRTFQLHIVPPQYCPICGDYILGQEIRNHVLSHCHTLNGSVDAAVLWLEKFLASEAEKDFTMNLHCFKCNYTCQFDGEFIRHVIADHVTCSCKADFSSLNELTHHINQRGKCKIICPICRAKKFGEDDILSFPSHVLQCVPGKAKRNLIFDISDLYPICFHCEPVKQILVTKFKKHLKVCHSINLDTNDDNAVLEIDSPF